MLYSITEALGTGSPQLVGVPPFLSKSHITVYVNSLPNTGFEWINDSTIRITAGTNHPIRVVRKTSPGARLSTYLDGQGLPADNLEIDSIQAFYLAQEALDLAYLGGSAGGNPAPGIELTTQGIKNLLAGQITPSELETTLRTAIGLIDANSTIVNSPAWRVAQEALGRAAAITAEQQARAAALLQEAQSRGAAITSVQTVLQGNIDSLASSVTTLTASTGANAAAIANEVTARTSQDTALAQSITTLTGTVNTNQTNLTATVNSDRTARINGDSALATTAETNRANLQSAINTVDARVTTVDSASVTRDNALSSRVTTLEAAVISGGGYSDTAIRADIAAVDAASATRDTALGARVTAIRAGSYGVSLNADPEFKAFSEFYTMNWAGTAGTVVGGSVAGRFAMRSGTQQTNVYSTDTVPVDLTRAYRASMRIRRDATASTLRTAYLGVRLFDSAGAEIGSWWLYGWVGTPGTSWGDISFTFGAGTANTFPGTAVSMKVGSIIFYDSTGSAPATGYHEVEFLRLDDYEVIRNKTELQASINTVDSARVTDRDAAATRLTALETKVGSPNGGTVTAAIAAAQSALALQNQATATDVTTLQTAINGGGGILTRLGTVETSASTTASKVTGVESQWTLKVQARSDGKTAIAGIGLNSTVNTTVTQSELILMADRIVFVPSGADFNGTPQPLLVAGVVNGQNTLVVPPSRMGDSLVEARMIVEGSIETRHLKVSSSPGLNRLPDPTYLDPNAWVVGPWGVKPTSVPDGFGNCMLSTTGSSSARLVRRVPVVAGRRYRFSIRVWRGTTANGSLYFRIDRGNTETGVYNEAYLGVEGIVPTANTWIQYSGEWIADAAWAGPMVLLNYTGTAGAYYATDIRLEEMIGGDVIVDGSVTAGKIDTRGLIVRDASNNIILGAGNALNPSYAASGTLNSDLVPSINSAATTANWTSVASRPTSLLGINTAEGAKLGGIEAGATVGATFGTNVYGQINAGNASTYIADAAIGNAQIGGDLWSTNYNPGLAGWVIRRNGTAEFQSVTVRGDVYATNLYGNVVDTGNIKAGAITSVLPASGTGASVTTSVTPPSGQTWRIVVSAFQATGNETSTTSFTGGSLTNVTLTGLGTLVVPRVLTNETTAESTVTYYHRTAPVNLTFVTDVVGPATYVSTFTGESGVYKAITMVAYKR